MKVLGSHLLGIAIVVALGICMSASNAAAQPVIDDERITDALRAFEHEPSIQEVHQQALEYRRFDADRPDRWTRRSRLSNLLPTLQGTTNWLSQQDRQDRFRENIDADDDGLYSRNNAQHLWRDDLRYRSIYSARATFHLSRLIYSGDEIAIQRELRQRWQMHDHLLSEVTELYFERRRLQLLLHLQPPTELDERLDHYLRLQALSAQLDAITGGWFQQQVDKERP